MKRLILCIIIFSLLVPVRSQVHELPRLSKNGESVRLMVDGRPWLMLSGELGNSSASSTAYMRNIWQQIKAMHLNTLLIPVYWELIEPVEGKFDFSVTDSMILSARKNDLKVVLLWFGSWKNSMSCYAPLWVKQDVNRFPRARKTDGKPVEILTPFSNENCEADCRAFKALMEHIREIDEAWRTVIMIQVENEIGMIPEARDHCDDADEAFAGNVPSELLSYLKANNELLAPGLSGSWKKQGNKSSGPWEEVFGRGAATDEIFMAWYFGQYTNRVASAGKSEYPLPMYANAALIRDGYQPGQYPSAGPLPHLKDIWKVAAPAIDFIAPDIYFRSFTDWTARYDFPGNPLFIPEAGNNQSMAQAFYAVARHDAMGYSPFSIESIEDPANSRVAAAYRILDQLTPLILANQGKGTMDGFLLDSINQQVELRMGDYLFRIKHEYSWAYATRKPGETPRTGGLIIMLGPGEYIIAGSGVIVTFEPANRDGSVAGIGILDEVEYLDGKWVTGRRMNGDQSHQGRHMHIPGDTFSMQKVKLYLYK